MTGCAATGGAAAPSATREACGDADHDERASEGERETPTRRGATAAADADDPEQSQEAREQSQRRCRRYPRSATRRIDEIQRRVGKSRGERRGTGRRRGGSTRLWSASYGRAKRRGAAHELNSTGDADAVVGGAGDRGAEHVGGARADRTGSCGDGGGGRDGAGGADGEVGAAAARGVVAVACGVGRLNRDGAGGVERVRNRGGRESVRACGRCCLPSERPRLRCRIACRSL